MHVRMSFIYFFIIIIYYHYLILIFNYFLFKETKYIEEGRYVCIYVEFNWFPGKGRKKWINMN